MPKGLGNVAVTKLGHDQLSELYYHTWIIRSGSHTYLFHGAMSSLNDALETVQNKTKSPYKPTYKKVNA